MRTSDFPLRARQLIAALASLSLSLLAGLVLIAIRSPGSVTASHLHSDDVQQAAVAQLVASSAQIFDSHPDPRVARVLQPRLRGVEFQGTFISSNRFGMREREYTSPKDEGIQRVVLLGDSYVFGLGVNERERLGTYLERMLRARSRTRESEGTRIEVLHIGIGSWNTLAECAYLEHQLSDLDPDLVIHVFVANDLDDGSGVRGFGMRSSFDPALPERLDGTLRIAHPVQRMHGTEGNALALGMDGESRARFAAAFRAVDRLARKLADRGTPYLFVSTLGGPSGKATLAHARDVLDEEQILVIGQHLMSDLRYRISAEDGHWNAAGHERVAQLLLGVIQERDLMPQLELTRWEGAAAFIEEIHGRGLECIEDTPHPRITVGVGLTEAKQVYGGIDSEYRVAPYACFVLSPGGRSLLELRGSFLDRPEMSDGSVTVSVDGVALGRMRMRPGEPFTERFEVPSDLVERAVVAVQLSSDEWAFLGRDARQCVSFQLEGARFVKSL